jgi:hypothetical protein
MKAAAFITGSLLLVGVAFVAAQSPAPPVTPAFENGVVASVDLQENQLTVRGGGVGSPRAFTVVGEARTTLRDVKVGSNVILKLDAGGRVAEITIGGRPLGNSPVASPVAPATRTRAVPATTGVPIEEAAPPVPPAPSPLPANELGEVRGTPQPTPRPVATPRPVGPIPRVSPAPQPTPRPVATPRPVLVPSAAPPTPIPPPTDVEPVPTPTPSTPTR